MASRLNVAVTGGAPNLLGSFTAAARSLPGDADWTAFGVSHTPENCGHPWLWQKCSTTEVEPKPLNEGVEDVTFQPFLVEYNAASCPGGIPGDWDQLSERARRGLALRLSKGIAEAFSSSTIHGDPNDSPNLPSTAIDITPVGGPSSLINTIAGLLEEAEACGLNGEIYIHAPGWTLPHWLNHNLIERVGNAWKMGPHTVILDQGYSNEGPTGEGSDPDVPPSPVATAGQAYIYVTGPFEYATGPLEVFEDTTRGVDLRLNKANVIAGQLAIYRFDPCCVFAALAQVC